MHLLSQVLQIRFCKKGAVCEYEPLCIKKKVIFDKIVLCVLFFKSLCIYGNDWYAAASFFGYLINLKGFIFQEMVQDVLLPNLGMQMMSYWLRANIFSLRRRHWGGRGSSDSSHSSKIRIWSRRVVVGVWKHFWWEDSIRKNPSSSWRHLCWGHFLPRLGCCDV